MEENQKEKNVKTKKKHTIRNIVIILLILIIALLCGTYTLHTQKILPDGFEEILKPMLEQIDKLFGIENEKEDKAETAETEDKLYKVITELDEKYKGKEVEIIDIYNKDTSIFDYYEEDIRNAVSILIVEDEIGLISNENGKILVEPQYDKIYAEMIGTDQEPYISVDKKDKKYKINLKTYEVSEKEDVYGHGGESYYFYEPETKEIYSQGYEYTKFEPSASKTKVIQETTGGTLEVCFEKEVDEYNEENEYKVGYFDVTNGKVEIKPEYDKATLFDNQIAGVVKNGKGYFINEKNEKVYDVEFEDVGNIHENRAWIKEDGKWKLIEFAEKQG